MATPTSIHGACIVHALKWHLKWSWGVPLFLLSDGTAAAAGACPGGRRIRISGAMHMEEGRVVASQSTRHRPMARARVQEELPSREFPRVCVGARGWG